MGNCCNYTNNDYRGHTLIQVASKPTDALLSWKEYTITRTLGKGASCEVYEVVDSKGNHYAMKKLLKGKRGSKTFYEDEVSVLKKLLMVEGKRGNRKKPHPNIIEFVKSWEDDEDAYRILTVLCKGGELYGRVKLGSFSERVAARLTAQMLEAVKFCHAHNVVHRDLKPENFMFSGVESNSPLKLIDFGCAVQVEDNQIVRDVAGSAWYVAPECLIPRRRDGKLWKCSDMWSIGIIVFLFVCGYPPFNGSTQEAIFNKIRKGVFSFPSETEFGFKFSNAVQEFVHSLLNPDPAKRLTAKQASEHPWVKGINVPETPIPQHVVDKLFDFRQNCRLKRAVARVMQNCMTESDKEELKKVFNRFDHDNNARLTPDEINQLMAFIGKNEKDGKDLMKKVDDNHDGNLSIDEMGLAYQMSSLGGNRSKNENGDIVSKLSGEVAKSFTIFDTDGDGFVDIDEIQKLCVGMTKKEAREMVQEVDGNADGRVNFDEWLQAMGEHQPKNGMTNKNTRIGL